MSYLQESSIQTKIGAQQLYQECPDAPYEKFASTGDGKAPPHLFNLVHSVGLPDLQMHVASSLLSARWYRAAFKCSSGRAMPVRTASFRPIHGSRPLSFLSTHTDWICNTAGVQAVVAKIQYAQSSQFNSESLVPYTVNGVQYGTFKTAGKLSFLNVFGAGHEIPAYQPVVALQAFKQTMSQQPLSST